MTKKRRGNTNYEYWISCFFSYPERNEVKRPRVAEALVARRHSSGDGARWRKDPVPLLPFSLLPDSLVFHGILHSSALGGSIQNDKEYNTMRNNSRFKKIYGVIILILIISFILLDRIGFLTAPKSILYSFLTPVQEITSQFSGSAGTVLKDLFSFHRLGKENEELRAVTEKLSSENARLQEIRLENNLLRKQLNVSLDKEHSLVIAYVEIGRAHV